MNRQLRERVTLKDGNRIVVLGGGPSGAFFAIHLLREAKKVHKDIRVTIIDKRMVLEPGRPLQELKGCNFCAGIISPRLQNELIKNRLTLPREVICEKFTHIWIHGLWKNFPLRVPPGQEILSVFRGTLPPKREGMTQGLDAFLLKKAVEEGADIITGEAQTIEYTREKKPLLRIKSPLGDVFTIESDFACICTGINLNPEKQYKNNTVFGSYQKINPLFKRPKARTTFIFELKPGSQYLKKYINKELYIIVSGSKKLDLEHIALIPKGDYLTISLVGKTIDRASFPEDRKKIIKTFLSLSRIQKILPALEDMPIVCTCTPYMAIAPAKAPFSDRIAMAGDALGARLYRDGLFSAFISAQALAHTVIHRGVDAESISRGYGWVIGWLKTDNQYGKFVIGLIQRVLKSPLLNRILYQTFATEMKFKKQEEWSLGKVLWKIGSGSADYRDVCKDLAQGPVVLSILTGMFKTFRNILTEFFFGLHWEDYGRSPTVIIKEKRDYIKKSIALPLGIKLNKSPEMERMYAIKIRASAKRIFKELGRFGDPDSKFLRLRFVDIKRVSGLPNQTGFIVRYGLRILPVSMDIRLIQAIPEKVLLYEPAELFTKQGKLLFDITPTQDGNNRLVLYTAFDFKKGKTPWARMLWKCFKFAFPEYAHDVVWNHAICCIKGEAEKNTQ